MTADKKTGSGWLTFLGFIWAILSPICLGLGVFFIAFYDSPINPQAGMGFLDYTLIGSVLSFPIVCVIASIGIWILNKRSKGAATFFALLPLIPLIPIILIFNRSNSSGKEDLGNAIQVSACTAPVYDGGDGLDTTGCGLLQIGMNGTGDLSTTAEAHNWQFTVDGGQVRISVRNDGSACPHVTVLNSSGEVVDGFEDENALRLCPSGMITTGFFEFQPPAAGTYLIRVFSPETSGTYWISIE